ncbi:hypothetical protein [Streptomyces sp. NPDC093094]|uniref:hypothetical protein n=1 Tax=Streptomyces sp. NPDC093094 TaxID=3366026 RepID=UPI00380CFA86
MNAGGCSRILRAAVFAAVCVLLASLGHIMMSGTAVPWWAVAVGAATTGGAAWLLAGRERGPLLVGAVTVAAQALLHTSFSLAQALAQPRTSGAGSLGQRWLGHLLCGAPTGPGTPSDTMPGRVTDGMGMSMGPMDMDSMGPMHHTVSGHPLDHAMGGMSSTGMLAAHLLAALLCGLWLAHGERAAFRILRALAGRLVAPLRVLLRLPAPPHRPRVRGRRSRSDRAPRQLLLTHAITSRGPPSGTAAAV